MSQSSTTGRASEPTPAQLKELFAQIESGRVTKERLQGFLRGHQPDFPSYQVAVDNETVEQLVRAGKYDWSNDDITSSHFPSERWAKALVDIFLVNFDHNISSEDAIAKMAEQGLRPATLKELLALGSAHPDLQRENPIVALGSTWRSPGGYVSVPYLYGFGSTRSLVLSWFGGDWVPRWRFAAVRK